MYAPCEAMFTRTEMHRCSVYPYGSSSHVNWDAEAVWTHCFKPDIHLVAFKAMHLDGCQIENCVCASAPSQLTSKVLPTQGCLEHPYIPVQVNMALI